MIRLLWSYIKYKKRIKAINRFYVAFYDNTFAFAPDYFWSSNYSAPIEEKEESRKEMWDLMGWEYKKMGRDEELDPDMSVIGQVIMKQLKDHATKN